MSGEALRASLRAYPTLLKVGFAEAVAYRAEALVWMLTNSMPLVNLALWHAIARSGPIVGYGQTRITAYFLAALMVRQLCGSWVLWEMTHEIRTGRLSMRLLRPVHPLIAYTAENLSALPLRAGFVVPVAIVAAVVVGGRGFTSDPVVWALVPVALVGAWLITFMAMAMMGALAFFVESAISVFDVWLAAYFTLSGYLFPLDFFSARAPWVTAAARYLPFYAMNGFPVEMLLGLRPREDVLQQLGLQWLYVAVFFGATMALWRAGLKRYNAFGA